MPADTALSSAEGAEVVPMDAAVVGVGAIRTHGDRPTAGIDLLSPVAPFGRRPPKTLSGFPLRAPVGVEGAPIGRRDADRNRDVESLSRPILGGTRGAFRASGACFGHYEVAEEKCGDRNRQNRQLTHGLPLSSLKLMSIAEIFKENFGLPKMVHHPFCLVKHEIPSNRAVFCALVPFWCKLFRSLF